MDIYEIRQALTSGKSIFDLPLRVTYYARVSTDKEEQLHSLSAQVTYYTEFIRNNPNWVFVEGYIDEGISGTSVGKRENFLRMMEAAREKAFDFIVTKEISRFSRNTLDSIRYTQELLRCGVGVLFQSDNINTLMPDAELRLTIMSSIAQDEVRKISERVKFGFKRAIEKGVVLGSNRIWGYRKQEGRLVIIEEEAEIVRNIFDLYANQLIGIRGICTYLTEHGHRNTNGNAFSFSTIRGILSNPKYKGYYCGGKSSKIDYKLNDVKHFSPEQWVLYKNEETVPPIVSEALWEKANQILAGRSAKQSAENKTSYQNKFPYSGKIICGIHRSPYYRTLYRYQSGNKEVWQCQEYAKHGRSTCKSPSLYTYEADSMIRQMLAQLHLQTAEIIHELIQLYASLAPEGKTNEEILRCRKNMEEILRRKDKLLDLSIDGRISDDEFTLRNERFNSELEELQLRLQELQSEHLKNQDTEPSAQILQQAINRELEFANGFSVGIIDALVDRLEVYGTDDKYLINVRVYLKEHSDCLNYTIRRKYGKPSVCTRAYT